MNKKRILFTILGGVIICLAISIALYFLPPIHSRLSWRVDEWTTRIKYAIDPPDEALFLPTIGQVTLSGTQLSTASSPTFTPTKKTAEPSVTVGFTTTPLPSSVKLPGVTYVDQFNRWNYCGPSNLTMALNFWGWTGTRDDVAEIVKPGIQDMTQDFISRGKSDKNVMPYELTGFVQDYTNLNVILRYGGDVDLLKTLISAGFPVVAEKGYYEEDYTGKVGWMGHYQFVTGYDDASQTLLVQDTYKSGPDFEIIYDEFASGWRSFDYIFFIVYPPEREFEVLKLLGPWADPNWSYQHSLEVAEQEINEQVAIDLFFAWFNKGTSLVKLTRYAEAAQAFDVAFNLYATLGTDNQQRPYRMMWYQTTPYMAYYYSGRYGDVINLANITLETVIPPTLEESYYWRGVAWLALGDPEQGIEDLRESVRLNMYFTPGIEKLAELGLTP